MEQGLPWEANSYSAGQGIPHPLWNFKIQNRLALVPTLIQIKTV
jgi:hypothetical protein